MTKFEDDPDSLDDGPLLTGPLWPSALPRPVARPGPTPPDDWPVPIPIRETATTACTRPRPGRLWSGAILFALGGAAVAFATALASRTAPPVPAETWPVAVAVSGKTPTPVAPREAALVHVQPDAGEPDAELETVVTDLPTIITEVSEPPAEIAPPIVGSMRLPSRPSNSEIANAIVDAQHALERCRKAHGTSGLVPIEIEVAPSGVITSVAVGLGSADFRTCIRDAVRRQRLPASREGIAAKFPIVVR
jgi:hypothetical protein